MAQRFGVVIVGGGIGGVLAAMRLSTTLPRQLNKIIILEKSPALGGRLSTRYSPGSPPADTGAQYFTIRNNKFEDILSPLLQNGKVKLWTDHLNTVEGPKYDNVKRYVCSDGQQKLPGLLLQQFRDSNPDVLIDVKHHQTVTDIKLASEEGKEDNKNLLSVQTSCGSTFLCNGALLTCAVTDSLSLLERSQTLQLDTNTTNNLQSIKYDPAYAVQLTLKPDVRPQIPAPGGVWPNNGQVRWLCDNSQKYGAVGYQQPDDDDKQQVDGHGGVTISMTTSAEFVHQVQQTNMTNDQIVECCVSACSQWIDSSSIASSSVEFWSNAIPSTQCDKQSIVTDVGGGAILGFCGDAFGPQSKVEGAALSALHAAESIKAAFDH